MNALVHMADMYISSIPVIEYIFVPNLTSEDDRTEETFKKGIYP